ncbi:hypothetical protein [Pseudomonas sp. CH235]|uniref:hypothetical protein n=2 Tax=unclassified Pseudomonas TaxID=196821 RepID=UPI001062B575|nr:hypothetical protein [Pseudomonas sp. CH235]TEA58638.1 hypothetical protein EIY71_26930 [Pseudomonas sp. CH235]
MKLISIAPRADAMNATTSPPIAIFALTPPQVLLKTDPVIGAHIGVSIVNHYKDPLGMAVLFGPWQGQDLYETVHLHLNNNPKPISSEIVFSISDPVLLRLPAGLLLEDINSLHCTVERLSGNGDTSPSLTVLYDAFAPGGDEQVPGGGHSALAINATPTSVDASQAAQGVLLTLDYPHKHLYDLITVDSGGVETKHRIEPTPTNPNPDLTQPITLTLTTPHFAKDPNNPQFPIKYNVISQTNNYSGTTQLGQFNAQDHWSIPCLIDVHLDWAELLEAILQEILGENGDDPAIVDLGKMNGGPLWALIHLINTIWQAGDQIHLTFEAWLNGVMVATHDETLPIGNVPGQFSWPIPNVKVVANSQVRVKLEQIRGGKVIGVSREAQARVVGEGLPDIEDFESTPSQGASEVGQSVSTNKIKVTLTGKVHPNDSLAIGRFTDPVDANGQAFYGYLAQPNGQITSLSYEVELIGRTANRLVIWIAGGNIFGNATQMNLVFRDTAGATLNFINLTVTAYQRQQQIDTGVLNGIKSIAVVVNGQVIIDRIQFL